MNRRIRVLTTAFAVFVALPTIASAAAGESSIWFSGSFGAAVTIIGAGYGIGKIGTAAVESMARQPEVAGQIQTAMIIAAALIEGVTLFALVVCIIHGAPWPTAG